ncbi:MAG: alpha-galactosidase [Lachnospiraceae bacterium]|nr:alpha-galactosidase [Lachnospiraceae bacterium]
MELIGILSPEVIELEVEGTWTAQIPRDVQIEMAANGEASVTAQKTGLTRIRFTYHAPEELREVYVYGDAWERGYGDLEWSRKKRVMPWYCMFSDRKETCGYGVKVQPNALCFWEYDNDRLSLTFDIRNGTECLYLNGKKLVMATLVAERYQGSVHEAAHSFCKLMCDSPRLPKNPVYGGNDWYCNYGDNSCEKIMLHAKRIAECAPDTPNRPYMVIDDGWQLCSSRGEGRVYYIGGPWEANRKFGDMRRLAKDISDLGVRPGIWMRPLVTLEHVPDECVLKLIGLCQVLDPSHEETIKMIKRDVRKIVGWGYKLIKHDFSTCDLFGQWGFSMGTEPFSEKVEFYDKTRTTAQIVKDFYMAIREAAGEDTAIIGCNTMTHLAAGIFEIQRTGDDTSGQEWERTRKMGVNTLAFRMMQHNAFYAVDADCVGITGKVSWEKNRQWLDVLAKSGTPLFVSIAEDAYTDEVKTEIKKAFEKAAVRHNASAPEDFTDTYVPRKWESDFGTDVYDWD